MNSSPQSTIPSIQRRVKTNARRLKLSIQHYQVFLTTPPNISEQKIQAFLKESESWLVHTWNKVYAQNLSGQMPTNGEKITLPLLNQCFEVVLENNHMKSHGAIHAHQAVVDTVEHQLIVPIEQAGKILKQWVRDQATMHLPQRLNDLAMQHGFEYSTCQVRHAKTRWGSCSAQKSISLNAGLILMPVALLDYVILHELCHTRQLNHSAKFWQEMQKVDVNYMPHRQQLKQFKLPEWWHVS